MKTPESPAGVCERLTHSRRVHWVSHEEWREAVRYLTGNDHALVMAQRALLARKARGRVLSCNEARLLLRELGWRERSV